MTTYRRWDVVLVPFPFTNFNRTKKRPALVVSPNAYNEGPDLVIAFVTSRLDAPPRMGDYRLQRWQQAGLPKPSMVRMKFATIYRDIVIKSLGSLDNADQDGVQALLQSFFLTTVRFKF